DFLPGARRRLAVHWGRLEDVWPCLPVQVLVAHVDRRLGTNDLWCVQLSLPGRQPASRRLARAHLPPEHLRTPVAGRWVRRRFFYRLLYGSAPGSDQSAAVER